jgi:hypothetical protein
MTTPYQDEYTLLLIKQYFEKPKARAEIEARMSGWDKVRALFASLRAAFDLDTAVGVQLDLIGRVVGLARTAPGSLLGDEDYRFLLKAKATRNNAGTTMIGVDRASVQDAVQFLFADGDPAWLADRGDMVITLYVPADTDADLLGWVQQLDLIPRPQGVRLDIVLAGLTGMFGFNATDEGFDSRTDPLYGGGLLADRL